MRPLWRCRVCAGPWPCQPARLLLLMEYRRDRVGLSVHMATCLFDATADLMTLNPNPGPSPEELFERFVGWTARREDGEHRPTGAGQLPAVGEEADGSVNGTPAGRSGTVGRQRGSSTGAGRRSRPAPESTESSMCRSNMKSR